MEKHMLPMKDVRFIVVHCTDTRVGQKVTMKDIRDWHLARNFADIGYHWVIDQQGRILKGRDEQLAGAHVRHYNQHAIGVCYIGGKNDQGQRADTRTPQQKAALWFLLKELKAHYPQAKITGHRDFPNVSKLCPCFDAQTEYASLNAQTEYASLNTQTEYSPLNHD